MTKHSSSNRRGMVLLVVLVVLALVSLGVYTFSEFMIAESQSTGSFGREAQARAAADSGVELAAALLVDRAQNDPQIYYNNPTWFRGILMHESAAAKAQGRFSVVAPVEGDLAGRAVRFGLIDESSRLNLNAIPALKLDETKSRNLLMNLPGMTVEIADAILDFIDGDDTPREFGAEDEYYSTLSPAYEPKNGSLDSLDELLLVRGVTAQLLYGEDANRNGLLDPNENDGDASPPLDNSDGQLQNGWAQYLTIFSRELNQQADGTPRINVNTATLADLYDQLAQALGENEAKFIVAYRLSGPMTQSTGSGTGGSSGTPGSSNKSGRGGSSGSGGSSGGGSSGVGSGSTATTTGVGQGQNAAGTGGNAAGTGGNAAQTGGGSDLQGTVSAVSQALVSGSGQITRGGMQLGGGGKVQITSLYSLIGAQVQVSAQNSTSGTSMTLTSPWSADTGAMRSYLPVLFDKLTIKSGNYIDGRVNINQARRELLLGLPDIPEALANGIADAQLKSADGQNLSNQVSERSTTGWLMTSGLTDLATLQKLDPYITARGDVYRLQSVGYFDGGGPVVRIEAVIDATQDPPQVIFQRDLTDLGRGYSSTLLTTGAAGK